MLFLYITEGIQQWLLINNQREAHSATGSRNWPVLCILYKGTVNMAEAQVWNNCSNNSCQIIGLSQCHFEISAHNYFLFFDYWY